ncbi:metal-binding protein [Oscillatoria amoena NRMC-F 0135]|nr:metal-binding protein [Oscillatoria amoena NRMC-F 0135]
MPSGATHDRVTLWSLPLITGAAFSLTRNGELTLLVAGGYLFSGLLLSPDLDLQSRPYKRWGWLRWLWIPYQKMLSHRSVLSHGLVIGTLLRVFYLGLWIALISLLILGVVQLFRDTPWSWQAFGQGMQRSLLRYRWEWLAGFIGLELGAATHILCDRAGSAYKRYKRYGIQGLKRKTPKRRTSTARKAAPSKARSPKKR